MSDIATVPLTNECFFLGGSLIASVVAGHGVTKITPISSSRNPWSFIAIRFASRAAISMGDSMGMRCSRRFG